MSTQQRKERRIKEQIRNGNNAIEERAALQTQVKKTVAEIDRLKEIEIQYMAKETRITVLSSENDRLSLETQELRHDLANEQQTVVGIEHHCDELQQALDLQKTKAMLLTGEIARLNTEEKDAKKLRRRLAEAKQTVRDQNSEISQLKAALKELE